MTVKTTWPLHFSGSHETLAVSGKINDLITAIINYPGQVSVYTETYTLIKPSKSPPVLDGWL